MHFYLATFERWCYMVKSEEEGKDWWLVPPAKQTVQALVVSPVPAEQVDPNDWNGSCWKALWKQYPSWSRHTTTIPDFGQMGWSSAFLRDTVPLTVREHA